MGESKEAWLSERVVVFKVHSVKGRIPMPVGYSYIP